MRPTNAKRRTSAGEVELRKVELRGAYGQEHFSLRLELGNSGAAPHLVTCAYRVRDYFGRCRAVGELDVRVPAGGSVVRQVSFRGGDCWRYRAEAGLPRGRAPGRVAPGAGAHARVGRLGRQQPQGVVP